MTNATVVQDLLGVDVIEHKGERYQAQRRPRLVDGAAYLAAVESGSDVEVLRQALALLKGMGFPAEVVDDLDLRAGVEYASTFFSAAFQAKASR